MQSFFPAALLSLSLFGACAQPGVQYKPTARIASVIADSFDADISDPAIGSPLSGDTNYSSVEFGVGVARYWDGKKQNQSELAYSKSSFDQIDADEFAIGGRNYFLHQGELLPFVSLDYLITVADTGPSSAFKYGIQSGLRVGLGAEYQLNENFFFDTSLRYLFSLSGASSDLAPSLQTKLEGFSLVVGVGVDF